MFRFWFRFCFLYKLASLLLLEQNKVPLWRSMRFWQQQNRNQNHKEAVIQSSGGPTEPVQNLRGSPSSAVQVLIRFRPTWFCSHAGSIRVHLVPFGPHAASDGAGRAAVQVRLQGGDQLALVLQGQVQVVLLVAGDVLQDLVDQLAVLWRHGTGGQSGRVHGAACRPSERRLTWRGGRGAGLLIGRRGGRRGRGRRGQQVWGQNTLVVQQQLSCRLNVSSRQPEGHFSRGPLEPQVQQLEDRGQTVRWLGDSSWRTGDRRGTSVGQRDGTCSTFSGLTASSWDVWDESSRIWGQTESGQASIGLGFCPEARRVGSGSGPGRGRTADALSTSPWVRCSALAASVLEKPSSTSRETSSILVLRRWRSFSCWSSRSWTGEDRVRTRSEPQRTRSPGTVSEPYLVPVADEDGGRLQVSSTGPQAQPGLPLRETQNQQLGHLLRVRNQTAVQVLHLRRHGPSGRTAGSAADTDAGTGLPPVPCCPGNRQTRSAAAPPGGGGRCVRRPDLDHQQALLLLAVAAQEAVLGALQPAAPVLQAGQRLQGPVAPHDVQLQDGVVVHGAQHRRAAPTAGPRGVKRAFIVKGAGGRGFLPEVLVGLQQVAEGGVKLLPLHQRAALLMEPHGQDQSLETGAVMNRAQHQNRTGPLQTLCRKQGQALTWTRPLAERLPVKPSQTQIFMLLWFWYQASSQNAENL
ncbi:hypothetical protein CCH79_00019574 [Gambusia affinis]|uniref:Uncharacterized protein n=1 Tax=Gambusia affinis TaxID=33528 RepID=A0A315V9S0_GAMAF|nr:hypothetical protein CCH79_00019574 [Gambusia affinis]